MTIPDRHDHEVAAHQRREEAAQARRDELAPIADERHDEDFDANLRLDNEWLMEEMASASSTLNNLWRDACRHPDTAEMGRIMNMLINRARRKSREWSRERGIERLNG